MSVFRRATAVFRLRAEDAHAWPQVPDAMRALRAARVAGTIGGWGGVVLAVPAGVVCGVSLAVWLAAGRGPAWQLIAVTGPLFGCALAAAVFGFRVAPGIERNPTHLRRRLAFALGFSVPGALSAAVPITLLALGASGRAVPVIALVNLGLLGFGVGGPSLAAVAACGLAILRYGHTLAAIHESFLAQTARPQRAGAARRFTDT